MIILSIPSEVENVFVPVDGILIGPLKLDDTTGGSLVSVRAQADSLSQGRRRYNENDVGHTQVHANLSYIPALRSMKFPNGSALGNLASLPVKRLSDNATMTLTGIYGFATTSASFSYVQDNFFYNEALVWTSPSDFIRYKIACPKELWMIRDQVQVDVAHYTLFSCTKSNTIFTRNKRHWGVYMSPLYDKWRSSQSLDEITSFCLSKVTGNGSNGQFFTGGTYVSTEKPSVSTSSLVGDVDAFIRNQMIPLEIPMEPVDYGDLAMEASAKVNANSVNMLAFLRDLKHPLEMFPKLKNLSKLKGQASNYLALEYGLLPTIDDLRSIVEALKKRAPYLDRYGYSTYTAVHSEALTKGDISFTNEQRIKIAVEDEDDEFVRLISSVESSGFSPTFENLWDLIPYSFVIDWFVNVGDFLERVDSRLRLARLKIRYSTMSQKTSVEMNLPFSQTSPLIGTIKVVRYSRWTSDLCPVPPLFSANAPTFSSHWLEGGALLLQRAKTK